MILEYVKQGKLVWELAKGILWIAVGLGVFYQFVYKDIPEINAQIKRVADLLDTSVKDQRSALRTHADGEQRQRERLAAKLDEAVSYLIALKSKVEGELKPEDVRRLVSTYKHVGAAEANKFSSVSIESGSPIPKIPTAITKAENYPELVSVWRAYDKSIIAMMQTPDTIEHYLPLLLMAKNARWETTERGLKVTYDGGVATLLAKQYVRPEDLLTQVHLFNSMSDSVQIISKGSWKVPVNPVPSKIELQRESAPQSAVPVPSLPSSPALPERRTPAAPGSLVR